MDASDKWPFDGAYRIEVDVNRIRVWQYTSDPYAQGERLLRAEALPDHEIGRAPDGCWRLFSPYDEFKPLAQVWNCSADLVTELVLKCFQNTATHQ